MKGLTIARVADKIGVIGAILAAASCPVCFPLLAAAGSAIGLSVLHPYEGKVLFFFQFLVLTALIGLGLSFRRHRKPLPLTVGTLSTLLIIYAFHIRFSELLNYAGLFGLLSASALNIMEEKRCTRCKTPEVKS
jgi:hypothetical protein